MVTQAASEETDLEVHTEPEQELEIEAATQVAAEGAETPTPEGEDDEVVVSLGDPPPPEEQDESRAPEWVRELRKQNREKDRKLRELETENARLKGAGVQPAAVVVGEEPTLEGCNYDANAFKREWTDWNRRKQDQEAQERQKADEAKKQQEAWQATLDGYSKEKSALKVKDFEDAEEAVRAAFSTSQQGIVLHGVEAGKRATLVYALGKNPQKLKELAAIADPVKFSFAVSKLEDKLKVTPKKTAPPIERRLQSSVAGAAVVDNQLEKLREEARKTGDLSKVVAYKRQHRG